MAIMAFVSQNEKEFHACPSMPHAVAAEAPHAVAAKAPNAVAADGTHAVAGDGTRAVTADRRARACATVAARRAPRRGPGPPQTAPHVPQEAVRKKYKASTHPPATLPLSPRVLECIFLFRLLTHNSPRPASS